MVREVGWIDQEPSERAAEVTKGEGACARERTREGRTYAGWGICKRAVFACVRVKVHARAGFAQGGSRVRFRRPPSVSDCALWGES